MEMKRIVDFNRQQLRHIALVQGMVRQFCDMLAQQAILHDQGKFDEVEYATFIESRESLNSSRDGNDEEYRRHCNSEAIRHHVENNEHHPEYWDKVGEEMPVHEAIIMFFDWLSRSVQRGTNMDDFWEYNVAKLERHPTAKAIVESLKILYKDTA